MPQMAPMLWLVLFFYFVLLFLLYISNFYFTYMPATSATSAMGLSKVGSFTWSW